MEKRQVFLLHYAGGNIYSFRFMEPFLKDVSYIPLELPGRGKRIREPLLNNFNEATRDICHQIVKNLSAEKFLIYGHSMGTLIGLKVAAMLEQISLFPEHLIVTGCPGPGKTAAKQKHLLEKQEFIEELDKLGGMPAELYTNTELFNFFEPILRADFELAETGNLSSFAPVKTPIHAIMGSDEEHVALIDNWKNFTMTGFNSEVWEGDHFFIHKNAARMAEKIRDFYYL